MLKKKLMKNLNKNITRKKQNNNFIVYIHIRPDINEPVDAMAMIAMLAQDSIKMAELCSMVYKLAEGANEFGFANFLADRQDAYRKYAWMLKSTLK